MNDHLRPPGASLARPTGVRHVIVAVVTLASLLLYLHRFCFSFAERYIREDLHLSDGQIALLLSAFFWSYALAQVPSGWLCDRFGTRLMLFLYILLWSVCTGLIGAAVAFALLLALRLGCGLTQAGAYPASAALVGVWVPFRRRGLASGVVAYGGRLGGAVAPVLTAYLIVAFVPAGAPSLLRDGDLLDARRLCIDLGRPDGLSAGRVARAVLERLPPPAAYTVRQCAEAPRPPDDAERQQLVAGLNDVLRQPDLAAAADLPALPLPQEALDLARLPPGRRTQAQTERLNRLLLEAAFPEAVRKLYVRGWRPVLFVYGAVGVLVAALFWLVFRNRPEGHPGCNKAEVLLIRDGRPSPGGPPRAHGLPLLPVLASRSLWLISLAQFMTNFGWIFLLTWLARYLAEVHGVPVLRRGWLAGLPLFVGMFGQLGGGWLTDILARSLGLRWGRALPMALSRFAGMTAFALCPLLRTPEAVTVALAVVALATDLGTPSSWAYVQDVGGRHTASVLGWTNMWGNFGAAVSPLALNAVIFGWGWPALFLACAAAYLVSGVAALGVDATAPVFPEEEPAG